MSLSQRLIEAQEAERRRIARELHDDVGQVLTAIKMNLQNIERGAPDSPLAQRLNESIGLIDSAMQRVRELALDLRPALLDDLGLIAALRWYVNREAQRAGLTWELVADPVDARLAPEIATACFRIAQEALTNVVRHARARHVQVELRLHASALHLTIRDDGIAFDARAALSQRPPTTLGLQGMEERALILGGQIEIDSAAGHGTEVRARFPLTSPR